MANNIKILRPTWLRETFIIRLYKTYVIDSIVIVKQHGLKELTKRRGWKFLLAIFLYYLVRDSIIYIVIPLLIAKRIIS